jgi:hypothetical protein
MLYSIPVADLAEFNALPQKSADKVRRLLQLFRQAAGLLDGGMSQSRALQAVSKKAEGQAYGTLKRYFPVYRKSGNWRDLLDDRFEAAAGVNRDFQAWCQKLALDNKRKTLPAWRAALRQLAAGDRIPGLGTWQECWRKENPGTPLPEACPYSVDGTQPKRLSQTSFYRFSKVTKTVKAISQMGSAAGRGELAKLIGFDTSSLMPFELLTFDDVRPDYRILDPLTGQVVELWLLVAMDVATRTVVSFACLPRRMRPDGTHGGITRRDMQHLIVGILRRFGIPRNYPMTLLVENASAAITSGFEAALHEASGGKINVRRTPMLAGNPWQDGWGEEGKGNPRAKGWIESAFNLMHNEGANIRGQIGADYSKKSQSIEPAARYTENLIKRASGVLSLTERRAYGLPFEDLQQARHDCQEIWDRMNFRRVHSLTGFDLLTEWRWAGQPTWNAWAEAPKGLPPEAWQQIQTRKLPESPWMRLDRLAAGLEFDALAASAVPALMLDQTSCLYHGGGILGFKVAGKAWRFDVADFRLEEGATLTAWYDSLRMEDGIHLTNGRGQFIGHAMQTVRLGVNDREALLAATKRKQQAFSAQLEDFRQITLTEEVLTARLTDAQANLDTVDMARAALPAPAENPDETAATRITRATTAKAAASKPLGSNIFGNARRKRGGLATPEIES